VPKEAKCDFPSASVLSFGAVAQPANANRTAAIPAKQTILIMPKVPFLIVTNRVMLRGWRRTGNSSVV
jgi:hypothetical protein